MTSPPPPKGQGGKVSFLKKKLGPQPTWAWMAEVLGLALVYALYKSHKAGSSASTAAGSSASGAVPADQIPDVIIQQSETELGPATTGPTTAPPPGPGPSVPPAQKPPPPKTARPGIPDYRQLAIDALRDKGIAHPSPQQIADEQNDIRATVGLGKAKGKPPKGGGTDKGVLPRRRPPVRRRTPAK
jgi:hypothetical protein